jgi:hypothetical protein
MTSTPPINSNESVTVSDDDSHNYPKTVEQITLTRKDNYGSQERCLIRDTLVSIYNILPPDKKYDSFRADLTSKLDSVGYTAPEILGKVWTDLYKLLEYHIPLLGDENNLLQNIQTTWNEGIVKYKELSNS